MEKKLNLHDLFGVLFPGAILWASIVAFLMLSGTLNAKFDWSATLALLPVAYVTGLLIQQIASRRFHEARIALTLMDARDVTFSAEFKERIKLAFEEVFRLPADPDDRSRQMMFDQCYDYVIQQNKGVYVESHYATYSLCRSMLLVCPVIAILSVVLVVRTPITLGARVFLLTLILALTALALNMFSWARNRFIKSFSARVYRSFYSAYRDCQTPCHKPASTSESADD